MALDFRASQFRGAKFITSGSTGTGAKLVFYDISADSPTTPNQGVINPNRFSVSSIGTDTFLYVSGGINSKGLSTNGVAVFGGDTHISGNLTVDRASRFTGGLSGSLTKLANGTSFLVAGNNITIVTNSNGSVVVSSTASGSSNNGPSLFRMGIVDYAETSATSSAPQVLGQVIFPANEFSGSSLVMRGVSYSNSVSGSSFVRLYNVTSGAYVHINGTGNTTISVPGFSPTLWQSVNLLSAANFNTSSQAIYELHGYSSTGSNTVFIGGVEFRPSGSFTGVTNVINNTNYVMGSWIEGSPSPMLSTTASVAIGNNGSNMWASNVGQDVYFFVSGTLSSGSSGDKISVFGGSVRVSGALAVGAGTLHISDRHLAVTRPSSAGFKIGIEPVSSGDWVNGSTDIEIYAGNSGLSNRGGNLSLKSGNGSSAGNIVLSPGINVNDIQGSVIVGNTSSMSRGEDEFLVVSSSTGGIASFRNDIKTSGSMMFSNGSRIWQSGSNIMMSDTNFPSGVSLLSIYSGYSSGSVPTSRRIIAGSGLTGGGELSSNVILSVSFDNATPQAIGTGGSGVSTVAARRDHVHAHGNQAGGTLHSVVTTTTNGFMSSADKVKLNALNLTSSHSSLSNLVSDDHLQYLHVSGTRAMSGTLRGVSGSATAAGFSVGNSDTGMYSSTVSSLDHLHFVRDGIRSLSLTPSSSIIYVNGTSSLTATTSNVSVSFSGSESFRFDNTGTISTSTKEYLSLLNNHSFGKIVISSNLDETNGEGTSITSYKLKSTNGLQKTLLVESEIEQSGSGRYEIFSVNANVQSTGSNNNYIAKFDINDTTLIGVAGLSYDDSGSIVTQGGLLAISGNQNYPSYSFLDNTNTGIYCDKDLVSVSITANGTKVVDIYNDSKGSVVVPNDLQTSFLGTPSSPWNEIHSDSITSDTHKVKANLSTNHANKYTMNVTMSTSATAHTVQSIDMSNSTAIRVSLYVVAINTNASSSSSFVRHCLARRDSSGIITKISDLASLNAETQAITEKWATDIEIVANGISIVASKNPSTNPVNFQITVETQVVTSAG